MHAIEATLDHGKLLLSEPLPANVNSARVIILVEDAPSLAMPAQVLTPQAVSAEQEFDALSLAGFVDRATDENVNWERYFGLKS